MFNVKDNNYESELDMMREHMSCDTSANLRLCAHCICPPPHEARAILGVGAILFLQKGLEEVHAEINHKKEQQMYNHMFKRY